MTTWGIIGLGWLGGALNAELGRRGLESWGTHRDAFNFESDPLPTTPCDVLFLNTPPLLRMAPADYVGKVAVTAARRVVFISSTSVFGQNTGRVTEDDPPVPETASAKWLWAVETQLREALGERLTVIRPGGLIGDERHPVYFLSKNQSSLAEGRINFIHREDLVRIIITAADLGVPLLNAVSAHHPLKSDYYAQWTRRLHLREVHVDPTKPASDRVVDSVVLPRLDVAWSVERLDRL